MRVFLFLCFLGGSLAWNSGNCQTAFTGILGYITKPEPDVAALCKDNTTKQLALSKIRGVLNQCGLADWATSNVADDKALGPMIGGILKYAEDMLCAHEKIPTAPNTVLYCFPQAMTVLDLNVIFTVFTNAQQQLAANTFSWDALDLQCKVMADPNKIKKLCATDKGQIGERCARRFGKSFDDVLRNIRKRIAVNGVLSPTVKKIFRPLKEFALTLQTACNTGERNLAVAFSGCNAGGPKKNLTVADIKAKICLPAGGINKDMLVILNKNLQHETGSNLANIKVNGGEYITRQKVNAWCCDATCQQARIAKRKLYRQTKTIDRVGDPNFFNEYQKDPQKFNGGLCRDACAHNPVDNPDTDCKVTSVKQGSLIVTLEINSTDPITCGSALASQYSIDSINPNSTQVSVSGCVCADCGGSSNAATGSGAPPSGSAGSGSLSGASALSFSFIGFLSSLFILCVLRW